MSTIIRTEIKLLLRHWGVWIVLAATVLLGYDVGRENTMSTLTHWIDESVLRFFLLGPLLLTISAGRRAGADRVNELLDALPYSAGHWVGGRVLANWLVWLLFSLPCWLVPALLLVLRGEGVAVGTLGLHWLTTAPISVAVVTAVGFALGHLPGTSIPGYLAAMAYYFAAVFVPMLTGQNGATPWVFLDFLAPQRWLPLTATGYFPNTGLVLLNRSFALSLGAGLVAVTVLAIAHKRRLPLLLAAAVLILSGVTAGVSSAGSHRILAARNTAWNEEAVAMMQAERATPQAQGQVTVDHYDLTATFTPAAHGLSVAGSFTVSNTGSAAVEQIDLTLRANLMVERVAGPDGAALSVEQAGNLLRIHQRLEPGEIVRLSAVWSGQVWHWRNDTPRRYEGLALGAHVAPSSIFLPATYGWYPIPGNAALYWATGDRKIWDLAPPQSPADFALKTTGTDLAVVTNAGPGAPGLYVIGTSLPTTVVDGVTYTVSPDKLPHAAAVVKALRPRAELLGHTALPDRVVELPEAVSAGLDVASELQLTPGAVLLHAQDAEWGTTQDNVRVLSSRWWNAPLSSYDIAQGLGAYMEWVLTGERLPFTTTSAEIMEAMVALDETKGRETAMTLLHELYPRYPEGLQYEELVAAFRQAAAGEPTLRQFLRRVDGI